MCDTRKLAKCPENVGLTDHTKAVMTPSWQDAQYVKVVENSTLLRRERPYEHSADTLKRQTSVSKLVRYDKDAKFSNAPRERKPSNVQSFDRGILPTVHKPLTAEESAALLSKL